jgi:AdoMet-dependent rRNA methyltransferase SPB1
MAYGKAGGKKANKAGRNKDKYYHLAKEQGYRARSAFKLVELNRQFDLLRSAKTAILDLCAAPGGWLQIARKYAPAETKIIGVDLMPIRPIHGCETFVEDITTVQCRSTLKRALGVALSGGQKPNSKVETQVVDLVLHDGAPNVGQNWIKDAFGQSELVLSSLKLATEFLRPRGNFVTKIFRSADYNSLLWVFHQLFDKVDATKPQSSRNASAEIFVVCRGFKAPARIDPRLLDARFVFKELDTSGGGVGLAGGGGSSAVDVMHKKALVRQRQRDGYDTTLGVLLTRRLSILEFLRAKDPIRTLTDASAFEFDENSKQMGVDMLPITSEEVKTCCEDLKLLGRKEFKLLLKWRIAVRRMIPAVMSHPKSSADDGDDAAEFDNTDMEIVDDNEKDRDDEYPEDNADAEISRDLSAAAAAELAKRKRLHKRAARLKQVALRRQRLGLNMKSIDLLDTDDSLFSLSKLKKYANGDLGAIDGLVDEDDGDAAGDIEDLDDDDEIKAGHLPEGGDDDNEEDEDDDESDDGTGQTYYERLLDKEKRDKLDDLEDELDTAYARYLATQERLAAQQKSQAETGKVSHGIKLSRRGKLERQAVLTEAALNNKLDEEQKRYITLLSGARGEDANLMLSAIPPASRVGSKRQRGANEDEANVDDDDDDFDDQENDDYDDDGDEDAPQPISSSLSAAASRADRWFSQSIFAGKGVGDISTAGLDLRSDREFFDEDEEIKTTTDVTSSNSAGKVIKTREGQEGKAPKIKVDDDGDAYPDWMGGIPRSDRDTRKARLKKAKERLEKRTSKDLEKEAALNFQIVPGGASAAADVDDEFRDVIEMEAEKIRKGAELMEDEDDDEGDKKKVVRPSQSLLKAGMGNSLSKSSSAGNTNSGFETVPLSSNTAGNLKKRSAFDDSDDSDDDDDDESDASSHDPRKEDYDSDTHAEMLALGKKLKRHTSAKALVDASYNRYSFGDDGLPAWFSTDEGQHFRPQLPISRSEIDSIKARFRDIAARPIKKVAEARARKKRKLTTQLEKAKRQAMNILADENEEMGARSKMKAIAKAYRSAEIKKPGSVYVVAGSKGGRGKGKGKVKFVDRLMKKERKATKRKEKHTKKNRSKK